MINGVRRRIQVGSGARGSDSRHARVVVARRTMERREGRKSIQLKGSGGGKGACLLIRAELELLYVRRSRVMWQSDVVSDRLINFTPTNRGHMIAGPEIVLALPLAIVARY